MTTQTPEQIVELIYQKVRTEGDVVPRDYQTIGGMWTVDTWVLGNVKAQMMDEGYTHVIMWTGLRVIDTHNKPLTYTEGDEVVLRHLASVLGI